MSNVSWLIQEIQDGGYDISFSALYGESAIAAQRERYVEALRQFLEKFGERDEVVLFSVPGRTELCGNHTDHNHGLVLAGTVEKDCIAVAARTDAPEICICSKGYSLDSVVLGDLTAKEEEKNGSNALVRGIAARLAELGYRVGGLVAYTTSDVARGSGLSSSAVFEVMMGLMQSVLYNNGAIPATVMARVAQYAENHYFGKPCGPMDALVCAIGGTLAIDFSQPDQPQWESIQAEFPKEYAMCIVNTGAGHEHHTEQYAEIPAEMQSVAQALGVPYLQATNQEALLTQMSYLREQCGDRAVLRAWHFFRENERVHRQVEALQERDFGKFRALIIASGRSSLMWLQNGYAAEDFRHQGVMLALAIAEGMLSGYGAWRIHGGGFGGTTQNFVPLSVLPEFTAQMEAIFGEGCCQAMVMRPYGAVTVTVDGPQACPLTEHENNIFL